MPKTMLCLLLAMSLPLAAYAKKYSPATWVQFADATPGDLNLQPMPKETFTLDNTYSKSTHRRKSHSKRHNQKNGGRKSKKAGMAGGTPFKLEFLF